MNRRSFIACLFASPAIVAQGAAATKRRPPLGGPLKGNRHYIIGEVGPEVFYADPGKSGLMMAALAFPGSRLVQPTLPRPAR